MPGAASQYSAQTNAQALHRILAPSRQNAPSAEAATPFADLLDTHESSIEPRERPDPAPRDPAPHQPTGVRSKPARAPDRNDNTRAASDDSPARGADDKAPAQDAKDTGDTNKTDKAAKADKTDASTKTDASSDETKVDLTVADATSAIAEIPQPVTPVAVAIVLPTQLDATAAKAAGDKEALAGAVLATPTTAPENSPAEDALAALAAAKPEKPAATKPAVEQPKDDEKAAKAQGPSQNAELTQAVDSKDDAKSQQGEKHAAHAEAKDIKIETKAEPRIDAPQADAPAPARTVDPNPTVTTPATPQTQAPAQAAATQAPTATSSPVPVTGLAVEIAAQSRAGKNHFDIRLDPPELGRINVRLEMDGSGNVTSHLIVDRVETLDLLRRDAPQLERALEQAGLKTSDNGLQFSLRDQSPQNPQQQQDNRRTAQVVVPDAEIVADSAQRQYGRLAGLGGGLDIRI